MTDEQLITVVFALCALFYYCGKYRIFTKIVDFFIDYTGAVSELPLKYSISLTIFDFSMAIIGFIFLVKF